MKKSWEFIPKILSGQKTIESRWYKTRVAPWDRIKAGDTVWFKESGEPVTARAEVAKVIQFADLNPAKSAQILKKYASKRLGFNNGIPAEIKKYTAGKKYCLLIFLKHPQPVKPFKINKSGFGSAAAWLIVEDISAIML